MENMYLYQNIILILNNSFIIFFYSLIGGLIPTLFWLWFWMHEDNKHIEPRKVIASVFLFGMLGVFVAFLLQKMLALYFDLQINKIGTYTQFIENHTIVNLIFVIIEELIKYICAYVVFFRTKNFNRPINAFIYLTTAALGFSAMENSLYIIKPLLGGNTISVIIDANIRFIGANILHVASSGLLALFIGYSFYKKPFMREIYIWSGLILAILLHWIFNYVLINSKGSIVFIFSSIWIITIFIIISLEKIKKIHEIKVDINI